MKVRESIRPTASFGIVYIFLRPLRDDLLQFGVRSPKPWINQRQRQRPCRVVALPPPYCLLLTSMVYLAVLILTFLYNHSIVTNNCA